ncbi:MAG: dienelactone hydrolase family protein [Rhodanobacteraceae bacterium]|nr:dienelactone hydrolase family protein [Rhodanobacteraceae bacterium]
MHRWVRRGFLLWAVISLAWLANSVRTQGVPEDVLRSAQNVRIVDESTTLQFQPTRRHDKTALIFICGAGIHPYAYAPLLRPIAETGYSVFIVELPFRFAPLAAHKDEAVNRVRALIAAHPEMPHWVIAGHSLGGALAARLAQTDHGLNAAFVLIGTTHPKDGDLSTLDAPITKIYATTDGIAPVERVMATRSLLPKHTKWVEIRGGNHSQFGHYGHQLFDGKATITREAQQERTRAVLLERLREGSS